MSPASELSTCALIRRTPCSVQPTWPRYTVTLIDMTDDHWDVLWDRFCRSGRTNDHPRVLYPNIEFRRLHVPVGLLSIDRRKRATLLCTHHVFLHCYYPRVFAAFRRSLQRSWRLHLPRSCCRDLYLDNNFRNQIYLFPLLSSPCQPDL